MSKQAQVCPVCSGKGIVRSGFYPDEQPNNIMFTKCRSCGGSGYVTVGVNENQVPKVSNNGVIKNIRLND